MRDHEYIRHGDKAATIPCATGSSALTITIGIKHGSWLNLIEGFFSKLARSVLRHIRVESKQELKDRIMAAMDEFNRHPVVGPTNSTKPPDMIRISKSMY